VKNPGDRRTESSSELLAWGNDIYRYKPTKLRWLYM